MEKNSSGGDFNTIKNLLIIIFLLLSVILTFLYFSKNKQFKTLVAEKEKQRITFQAELDSLLNEHEKVKSEYGSLTLLLSEKDSIIQANAKEIQRLLNTEWEYYRVQKKLEQLRKISQGYLKQMDSLYTVNRELKEENVQIRASYEREKLLTRDLKREKDELAGKIELVAVLKAYGIQASGISVSGGQGRESVTEKARRTDKIKVCFTLAENAVATPGLRNVYIRIARPDTRILVKGLGDEFSFLYQGEILQYTSMETVNYQNRQVNICTEYVHRNPKDPLLPGTYYINIFCDDQEIGQSTFSLK